MKNLVIKNLQDIMKKSSGRVHYQDFSGSGTFVVPEGVDWFTVYLQGAGGGGGGGGGSHTYCGGGGGGGGGSGSIVKDIKVNPGDSFDIIIAAGGAGGAGGAVGTDGSAGGNSDTTSFGSILSITGGAGGAGGIAGTSSANGAGGTGGIASSVSDTGSSFYSDTSGHVFYTTININYNDSNGSDGASGDDHGGAYAPGGNGGCCTQKVCPSGGSGEDGSVDGNGYSTGGTGDAGGGGGGGGRPHNGDTHGGAGGKGADGYCVVMWIR